MKLQFPFKKNAFSLQPMSVCLISAALDSWLDANTTLAIQITQGSKSLGTPIITCVEKLFSIAFCSQGHMGFE